LGSLTACELPFLNTFAVAVETVRGLLNELGLTIEPFSVEQAESAAQLWKQSRHYGLSLEDRACLTLAMQRETIALMQWSLSMIKWV